MSHAAITINPVCAHCAQSPIRGSACGRCHTVRYCSRICQRLDWNVHKQFCRETDKVLALARRTKCLEIIRSHPTAVFNHLFRQVGLGADFPGFLFVAQEERRPTWIPFESFERLCALDIKLSKKEFRALGQLVEKSTESGYQGVIPTLFADEAVYAVYLLGSDKASAVAQSIKKMPSTLVAAIIKGVVFDELTSLDERESNLLQQVEQAGLLPRFGLNTGEHKAPAKDAGA